MAVTYAQAGIDGIAPSDMMDGRTESIRSTLDNNNYALRYTRIYDVYIR